MTTYPYLTTNRYGNGRYVMDDREAKAALGLDPTKKIPADVRVPPRLYDGVMIQYLTSDEARRFWNKKGMALRALAECPDCGRVTAFSRINQHARVHYPRKWTEG